MWTGSRGAGGGILTVTNFSIQNVILCTELTNATELMLVAYLVKIAYFVESDNECQN
jgi:hypothetical protein